MISPAHAVRIAVLTACLVLPAAGECALRVSPGSAALTAPEDGRQLVVSATVGGRYRDLTATARYSSSNPRVVRVDAAGRLTPVADGSAEVAVRSGGEVVRVPVRVTGMAAPGPVRFRTDVVGVLSRAGCNSGTCHGKAEGKGGFRLSVFGFDPEADHRAITWDARSRRVTRTRPHESLLLKKAAALVPHGGGRRLSPESPGFRILARWLAEGARWDTDVPTRRPVRLEVTPGSAVVEPGTTFQLRVECVFDDGSRRCVTSLAEYQANAGHVADVDAEGRVHATRIPGESAVMARYLGLMAVCRTVVPRRGPPPVRPPEHNFVDRLTWDKLQLLGLSAAGPAGDGEFLRRAFLDVIGTLPTVEATRAFLQEAAGIASRRAREALIDRLLERPEYADYWAMRWADVLRVDRDALSAPGAVAMTRWLRARFADNVPYDTMVREILTARGPVNAEGAAGFYQAVRKPEEMARSVAQLFLGVRIECAECHHHPSDRWGQDDFFAFAGLFTGVERKKLPGGGEAVLARTGADLRHPRTQQVVAARPLGATPVVRGPDGDLREELAGWVIHPDNPFFARAIANRIWKHYFGRGLVEPVDDLRPTNPASNEPLLAALATHMREVRYDLKAFTRTLLRSRLYQASSQGAAGSAADEENFTRALERSLPAEVLLDAISQVTGVPERFPGWPAGYRAIQVWDNRLAKYFFQIFGRPVRASVCECERSNEPSIAQALHLLNSPEMAEKLRSPDGYARRLADSTLSPRAVIQEVHLAALCRPPTPAEEGTLLPLFADSSPEGRRAGVEDALWAVLNTREFLFNH